MNIVIMAGGKGSRIKNTRKPFINVCGRKLIDVVLDVARNIRGRGRVYVCTRSDLAYELSVELGGLSDVEVVVCPGTGYVDDLNYILSVATPPTLVLPADIPFLKVDAIERFLDVAKPIDSEVITLVACREAVCRETGISFFKGVGGRWVNVYFEERPELKDIDTPEDLNWAENLCEFTAETERPD